MLNFETNVRTKYCKQRMELFRIKLYLNLMGVCHFCET